MKKRIREQALPHALLFVGGRGVGKRLTARALAMALNCQSDPETGKAPAEGCGACRACRKIETDQHPDVIWVSAAGVSIRIEQIRDLCRTLALKPFEASTRVAVIPDAQAMTASAANALLKVLEEPPAQTLLILTAIQTAALLPTIVSRCQLLRFSPIDRESLTRYLVARHGAAPEEAAVAAELGGGGIPQALEWMAHQGLRRRDWIMGALGAPGAVSMAQCLALAEKIIDTTTGPQEDLNMVKTWLRDVIIYRWTPKRIVHKSLMETISSVAHRTTPSQILSAMAAVEKAEGRLRRNLNPRLAMEMLMIRLSSLGKKAMGPSGSPETWK